MGGPCRSLQAFVRLEVEVVEVGGSNDLINQRAWLAVLFVSTLVCVFLGIEANIVAFCDDDGGEFAVLTLG
jgi:hypothetical protein